MSTTAITIQNQVTTLQQDIKTTLEEFFASLPEMDMNISMATALVEQAKPITVFQRNQRGAITVSDPDAYVKASEQVQALKSVGDEIEDLMKPFIDRLFKAHRTATAIRAQYLKPIDDEVKRLKLEREGFAAEEERKRRVAAIEAQEAARKAEEARLLAEAQAAAAEGDSVAAEAILAEAVEVQAPAVVLPSTVPHVQGQSFRSVWEWILEDATKLKAEFIQPREKEIGALVRSMHQTAEMLVGQGAIRVTERKVVVDR
jgi:hypothetical protein